MDLPQSELRAAHVSRGPLPPLVPPLRFSLVEEGVYRGAYPSLINLRFLTRLGIKSMVSLLPEPPAPHLLRWCEENGVRNHAERVAGAKDGEEVMFTNDRVADLLQLLVLPERQPVYVHCLDGIAVTGVLVMCLRKLQRWAPAPIVAEYARFARDGLEVPTPPPPPLLSFVNGFKPELEFARLLREGELLPFWLEAALSASTPAAGSAGRQQAPPTGAVVAAHPKWSAEQRESDHPHHQRERGAERERSRHGGGGGSLDPAAALLDANAGRERAGGVQRVSSGLDALAIEGLTMGRTQRTRSLLASSHTASEQQRQQQQQQQQQQKRSAREQQ